MRAALFLLVLVAACSESPERKELRIWHQEISAPVVRGLEFQLLDGCLRPPAGASQADLDHCRRVAVPGVIALSKARVEATGDVSACQRLFQALPLDASIKPWIGDHCCQSTNGLESECAGIGHPIP